MSTLGHDTEDRDRFFQEKVRSERKLTEKFFLTFRAAVDGRYTASHQTAEESQWQPKKREPPGRDDPEAVESVDGRRRLSAMKKTKSNSKTYMHM